MLPSNVIPFQPLPVREQVQDAPAKQATISRDEFFAQIQSPDFTWVFGDGDLGVFYTNSTKASAVALIDSDIVGLDSLAFRIPERVDFINGTYSLPLLEDAGVRISFSRVNFADARRHADDLP